MLEKKNKNPNLRVVPEEDKRRTERSVAIGPLCNFLLSESLTSDELPIPDKVITFEDMADAVGLDIANTRIIYQRAKEKLRKEKDLILTPYVLGKSVKVCVGDAINNIGKKRVERLNRESKKTLAILNCISQDDMTPEGKITTTALKSVLHFNIKSTEIKMLKNIEQVCIKTNPRFQVQRTLELFIEGENKEE